MHTKMPLRYIVSCVWDHCCSGRAVFSKHRKRSTILFLPAEMFLRIIWFIAMLGSSLILIRFRHHVGIKFGRRGSMRAGSEKKARKKT